MSASEADADDGEQDIELTQTQPTRAGWDEDEQRGPLASQDSQEEVAKEEAEEEVAKQEAGSDPEEEESVEASISLTQGEMQAAEAAAQEIERAAAEAEAQGEEEEGNRPIEESTIVEEGEPAEESVVAGQEGEETGAKEEDVKPEGDEETAKEEQEEETMKGEGEEEEENEEQGPGESQEVGEQEEQGEPQEQGEDQGEQGETQEQQEGEQEETQDQEQGEGETQETHQTEEEAGSRQNFFNTLFGSDSEGEEVNTNGATETVEAANETTTQPAEDDDMKALFGSDSEGEKAPAETDQTEASYRDLFGSDSEPEGQPVTGSATQKKKKAVASGPPTTIYTAEVPPGITDCGPIVRFNLSNVLAIEPKKYDPDSFIVEEHTREVLGRSNKIIKKVRLATENVIRWRTVIDEEGNEKRESNARLVEWEDGSKHLYLGGEIFRVEEEAIDPSVNLLFVATPLKTPGVPLHQCFGGFSRLMKFEPTKGVDSKSHAKLTSYIKQSHLKLPKIKRTTTAGMNDKEIERMQQEFEKQQRAKDRQLEARRGKRREEEAEGITAEFLTSGVQDEDEEEEAQAFSDEEGGQRLVNAKTGVLSDQEATEDEDQVQKIKRRRARETDSAEEEHGSQEDQETQEADVTKKKRKKHG